MTAEFSIERAGLKVTAQATWVGRDCLICITGGDTPHIGTVSNFIKETLSQSTFQFPSHDGRLHKDHVLAEAILERISAVLPANATVTSGVHVNGITAEQIKASLPMSRHLGEQIATWIRENPPLVAPAIYKTG